MIRKKLTVAQFQAIKPGLRLLEAFGVNTEIKHGQVNLLISGNIEPCTGLAFSDRQYSVVGATINFTTYTIAGKAVNNRDALKQCDSFSVRLPNLETGEKDYYKIDVLGKKVYVDYIYFKCNTPISASNISFGSESIIKVKLEEGEWGLAECLEDSVSGTVDSKGRWIYDYSAYLPEFEDLQYFPHYTSDFFKDDYNPLINNASASRTGSTVVDVGPLSGVKGFIDRNKVGKAEIPDYWYASVGLGLGRYIGTKCTRNLICEPYVGFKQSFTKSYLSASKANFYTEKINVSGSSVIQKLHRSIDRPFYTVQTFVGSVFMSGSVAEVTSSIRASDTRLEELKFSADSNYAEVKDPKGNVIKAWEQVKSVGAVPGVGDVLYRFDTDTDTRYRLTDCMVFVPEAGQLLCTDNYGVVNKYYEVE